MKEKAREALESWGIPETEIQEILDRNNEKELSGYIKQYENDQKIKAKISKPNAKAKSVRNPKPVPRQSQPVEFDPVTAAEACINKKEDLPYEVLEVFEVVFKKDVDEKTMEEFKKKFVAMGGRRTCEQRNSFLFNRAI